MRLWRYGGENSATKHNKSYSALFISREGETWSLPCCFLRPSKSIFKNILVALLGGRTTESDRRNESERKGMTGERGVDGNLDITSIQHTEGRNLLMAGPLV